MKKQAIAAALLLSASAIQAQNNTWQATAGTSSLWEQFLDNLSDYDDIEAGNTEEMYELLHELETNPIDLNNATDDDIQRLVFLSNAQREELTEYLDRHRPIRSIGELAMIKSLDNVTLRLLNCFVYVGNIDESRKFPTWKEIAKHGKNELLGYMKVPFYERKGDREAYLGYKYKHWIRYKYSYGQFLQVGFTGTQDAGEPFFGSHNKMGYDHYAFYALARKIGKIRTLALGQYKARFGLGLVMNAGFGMGKTTSMVLATPQNSITANASRSEAAYLQGVASTIEIYKNITTTAFASYRKIDATLNDDSTIKTILKTGYHRTETEIKKRHNASQTTAGMNVNVKHNGISVGATAVYTAFSKDLKPDKSQAFRLYSPNGNNFWNVSIDYAYIHPRISVKGETATGNSHALATINTISLKASRTLTLTAIQRFYSYKYYSLFSRSFSDGGHVQNESGMYLGATWTPFSQLKIMAYSDYAYHPMAVYRAFKASRSIDNLIQTTLSFSPVDITLRYRLRLKQENGADASSTLIDKTEHRGKVQLNYKRKHFTTRTQYDMAYTTKTSQSIGWMVSQSAGYKYKERLECNAGVGYFRTHDYDSRIYTYERGMLYDFSFPMFYGEGMRFFLNLQVKPIKSLQIGCKVATTKYFDREKISSGHQEINDSKKTDMEIQAKLVF